MKAVTTLIITAGITTFKPCRSITAMFLPFSIISRHSVNSSHETVQKLGERIVYSRYRTILQRDVILPTGKEVSFDIVHQEHPSIVVFSWNISSSTCTLIREYHPGPQCFMYGTVAGMYEAKKHSSPLQAAQYELEEEAHLKSNNWHILLGDEKSTASLDKYSTNQFYAYLALDCEVVEDPKAVDDEEYIVIERNISFSRLMELVNTGQINIVSSYAILLALRKLTQLGIPLE